MAITNSALLQALGWATLNSFWQMAALWCVYLAVGHFTKITSNQKYLLAVYSVFAGAGWFVYSFVSFYINGHTQVEALAVTTTNGVQLLPTVLVCASISYLLLLAVPAYRVFQNWRFLQTIKRKGLEKAPAKDRLFVQRIAAHIGIQRKVMVHLSGLVTSPMTIGYLKPIILIPFAALNNLTPAQLEAVLLHELSHIKRYDYLVNLLLTAVHVVLYFNPFVKLFIRAIEAERENCCDELVLQFEYDKVSYASALLQLEKTNHLTTELAMGATHKAHLLSRIEKIVGVKRKAKLNASHFLGAFAALLLLLTINSMIIARKTSGNMTASLSSISEPYSYFTNPDRGDVLTPLIQNDLQHSSQPILASANAETSSKPIASFTYPLLPSLAEPVSSELSNPDFKMVAFDEVDASLTEEQKEQVKTTLSTTKRALEANWSQVERSVPDGMLASEKEAVKSEYLKQVENINWQRMEQNMKAGYEKIDWHGVNVQLANQLALAKLDSVQTCMEIALVQLENVKVTSSKVEALPFPDASVKDLKKAKADLKQNIREIKAMRSGKIIKL
jgi:beta-lactamase regulating signal transducer with metallopeptidase domain